MKGTGNLRTFRIKPYRGELGPKEPFWNPPVRIFPRKLGAQPPNYYEGELYDSLRNN